MSVFKAYDIRGIAGSELDTEFSERLGRAIATHLDADCVSVVRDIRIRVRTTTRPSSGPNYFGSRCY